MRRGAGGPGVSLRCGLAALAPEAEAALVVLADGPDLDPRAIERVVAAWRSGGGDLLAASYDGARGHPLLLARPAWSDVPDEGLRAREPLLVPCDDLRAPGDVDRPADLPGRLREGELAAREPRSSASFASAPRASARSALTCGCSGGG